MILANFIILFLAVVNGVKSEDALELIGSGDGETTITTKSTVSLIDENGDIHNGSICTSEPCTNETSLSENESMVHLNSEDSNETTSVIYNTEEGTTMPVSSVTFTDTPEVVTTEQSTTTDQPTTEATTESDSTTTASTTTVSTTTSTTMLPTTVPEEESTLLTKLTSAFSSTTTMKVQTGKPAEQISEKSTTEQSPLPDVERHMCSFLDSELSCSEDLVCYGEGEIDCTEEEEMTFIEKISLSSISEDDYVLADSGTIGTFPPNLVGVVPPKKIPFFYHMRSLATTEDEMNATSETMPDSSSVVTEVTTEYTTTVQPIETSPTTDEDKNFVPSTEITEDATREQLSTMSTVEKDNTSALPFTEVTALGNETTESVPDRTSYAERTTEEMTNVSSTMNTEEVTEISEITEKSILRRKREDTISTNSDSSSPSKTVSFQVAALEGPKKKLRVKLCRLSGDLVCTPAPSTAMCKGKTFCQATSATAETAESPTSKGVETWAIVVIVVCGLSGFLTVCLLIYLVVTSCKKLKVQPAHEVTTLNYINRGGAGQHEMA